MPHEVAMVSSSSSTEGSQPGVSLRSARQFGWAAFDTPVARQFAAAKARVAVIIFSLHLFLFQLILAAVYPDEVGASYVSSGVVGTPGILFLALALLYLLLAALVGLDAVAGEILGYVLTAASLFLWILVLAAGPPFSTSLPQSAWLVLLSIIDSIAIVIGLLVIRDLAHEPRARPAA